MADSMRITNFPDSGSRERVAYDLCNRIAAHEDGIKKDRAYWLDLYYRSLSVVTGNPPGN